jgi:hypothetical protein
MKYDLAIRKLEIAIEKGQNNAMSVCLSVTNLTQNLLFIIKLNSIN